MEAYTIKASMLFELHCQRGFYFSLPCIQHKFLFTWWFSWSSEAIWRKHITWQTLLSPYSLVWCKIFGFPVWWPGIMNYDSIAPAYPKALMIQGNRCK